MAHKKTVFDLDQKEFDEQDKIVEELIGTLHAIRRMSRDHRNGIAMMPITEKLKSFHEEIKRYA